MGATLFVCTTCRGPAPAEGERPGALLADALACALSQAAPAGVSDGASDDAPAGTSAGAPPDATADASHDPTAGAPAAAAAGVTLRAVECLSACTQGCAIALSAPGKWSYVYGRLTAADAPDILAGAARYAASPDGIVPWRERPQIFRKQSIARIPPQE